MQERVGFIVLGGVLGLIGTIMIVNGFDTSFTGETQATGVFYLGALLTALGGILAQIGIIAVGVALGMKSDSPTQVPAA